MTALADELGLARVVMIDMVTDDVFRVSTFPAIGGIDRRFRGRDAFIEALALASKCAAALGYRLTDRTHTMSEAECAALVERLTGYCGAEIV